MLKSLNAVLLLCMASATLAMAAEPQPEPAAGRPDKDWSVDVTPYGWLAMLYGKVDTTRFGNETFRMDANDVLDTVDLGAMLAVEARWKRYVVLFDIAWARLSADNALGSSRVSYDVSQKLGWMEALAGYRVYERPGGLCGTPTPEDRRIFGVDALAGLTYSWTELDLELSRDPLLSIPAQERKINKKDDWVAPYTAVRLENDFTDVLGVETLLGLGGFGIGDAPDISWQVTSVLSYGINERVSLKAGYRALGSHYSDIDLIFHGPIIGAEFHF